MSTKAPVPAEIRALQKRYRRRVQIVEGVNALFCESSPHWLAIGSFPRSSSGHLGAAERYLKDGFRVAIHPGSHNRDTVVYIRLKTGPGDRGQPPERRPTRGYHEVLADKPPSPPKATAPERQRADPRRLALLFALFLVAVGTYKMVEYNRLSDRKARFNAMLRDRGHGDKYLRVKRASDLKSMDPQEGLAVQPQEEEPLARLPQGLRATVELSWASPVRGGELVRTALDDAVLSVMPGVGRCYHQALLAEPGLARFLEGEMTIEFVVDYGTVLESRVVERSFPLGDLDNCVLREFLELRVPKLGSEGDVTASYTFALSPWS